MVWCDLKWNLCNVPAVASCEAWSTTRWVTDSLMTHAVLNKKALRRVNASCTAVLLHIASGKYVHVVKAMDDFAWMQHTAAASCKERHLLHLPAPDPLWKVKKQVSESAIIVTIVSQWQLSIKDEAPLTSMWPLICVFVCFVGVESHSSRSTGVKCCFFHCKLTIWGPRLRPCPETNRFCHRTAVWKSLPHTSKHTYLCEKPVSKNQ